MLGDFEVADGDSERLSREQEDVRLLAGSKSLRYVDPA
jgi:hypothetical protein